MKNTFFAKCCCGCSGVEIEDQTEDKEFFFSMWTYGIDGVMDWKQRLRWCWNIIKTGTPWVDHTILSDVKAKEMAEFIQARLQIREQNKCLVCEGTGRQHDYVFPACPACKGTGTHKNN